MTHSMHEKSWVVLRADDSDDVEIYFDGEFFAQCESFDDALHFIDDMTRIRQLLGAPGVDHTTELMADAEKRSRQLRLANLISAPLLTIGTLAVSLIAIGVLVG